MQESKKEISITKNDLEKILCDEKKSLRTAAKIFGVTHKKIFVLAKKFGIESRSQVAKNRTEEIFEMHCNGVSSAQIANRIGCTRRRVEQIIQHYERAQCDDDDPQEVEPYRCPHHGIVRFSPCVACIAEGTISQS
jgi:hypothetical protein